MTENKIVSLCGITGAACAPVISHVFEKRKETCFVIVSSLKRAQKLADDLSFFTDEKIYILPDEDYTAFEFEAKNHDVLLKRMEVIGRILKKETCIVIATINQALKKLPPKESLLEDKLIFSVDCDADIEEVKRKLSAMGYERFSSIYEPGQFAVRGDILDIFTPEGKYPYRIEFFDTKVDAIRKFDAETQRSVENIDEVSIYPASSISIDEELFSKAAEKIEKAYKKQIKRTENEEIKKGLISHLDKILEYMKDFSNIQVLENLTEYIYEKTSYIWEYTETPYIFIDDPDRVRQSLKEKSEFALEDFKVFLERGKALPSEEKFLIKEKDISKIYEAGEVYILSPFVKKIKGVDKLSELKDLKSRNVIFFNGNMELLKNEIKRYLKGGFEITISCSSEERKDNIAEFLSRESLLNKVELKSGILSSGMEFPEERRVWISDNDIFTATKKKRTRRNDDDEDRISTPIKSFSDIQSGDFVVHENHGIGKFLGIKQLEVSGEYKDYLHIKYAGNDSLYVPVEQMDIVQKYSGQDTVTPKVNSLSGVEWNKTKSKAKAAIAEMAADLIELAAKRKEQKGYAFSSDSIWQKDFEDSFPYVETYDQLKCVKEIKKDMESTEIMDRLLCGDVGFGKTEVAARALFKCVADGKQAAVLAPTTILANQHYYTLKERFEAFPFKVEVISRFKTEKETKEILDKLKRGQIDLIIGTHKLLSKNVEFKDLGLLVIDEEQRFGVRHKETIKKLKANVDVLTLSATPIPRTLHMSLSGIRDMSVISKPPEDRYPVQTYVLEQDDYSLRTVIERELSRGGQVYVVYNRVNGIVSVAEKIRGLVPDARVITGHGRMKEDQLENVMMEFIDGDADVLVCTTIIETGLDIPNVNTIIILDTDRFGLSQLYQLRGRVGRTNRMAYAYLMYQPGKVLTEVAQKRLKAIKDFTEFGSGFKVAMRDLEIRGAGNILGTSQSGHMMNIGYELYCKMVNDAVRALKGEVVNDSREETKIEINVGAYIPDSYIGDEKLKLHAYKKIAEVYSKADEEDIIEELIDRFGDIPKKVLNLIKISRIRKLAQDAFVERVCEENKKAVFYFGEKNMLRGPKLAALSQKYGSKVFFHGGIKPFMRLTVESKFKLDEIITFLEDLNKM